MTPLYLTDIKYLYSEGMHVKGTGNVQPCFRTALLIYICRPSRDVSEFRRWKCHWL